MMTGRPILKNSAWTWTALLAEVLLLAACSSRPLTVRAPVEDRTQGASRSASGAGDAAGSGVAVNPSAASTKPLPGAENAGKPGYYTVKPGDTLIRIGLDNGHNWRDIARWNNLENPNTIEVGQVLRVIPPGAVVNENGVITRPVGSTAVNPVTVAPTPVPPPAPSNAATAKPANPAPVLTETEEPAFSWPLANGSKSPVLASFEEGKNKGIDLGGQAGDPVLAVADGRVVYAGSGLRGYGNLIILKHNETYLTAYAHSQKILVKEDQTVRKGQKIAEMGNTDADRVMLHFEVRKQGKPVDPTRYLPAR